MQTTKYLIVGSGFSGLGLAIRLKKQGIKNFTILERATEVGGTWRDNTYPGCACDVQSHLYSYSFAPNPNWSRSYSPQPEILQYLKSCVQLFDIGSHIRYDTVVSEAHWLREEQLWEVQTSKGVWRPQYLISAAGPLSDPSIPKIPGLENFKGPIFHSSRWDHSFDFKNKKVAVVGTGASAIQFIPILQKEVSKLTVFQRMPAWVVPRPNRKITETEHSIFKKMPRIQQGMRDLIFWSREIFIGGFRHPKVLFLLEAFVKWNLAQVIQDKKLRKKLTPSYRIGCKRILLSDDYWPALAKGNVEVIDHAVENLTSSGVVADGIVHEVDAVIFATGFHVTDSPFYARIKNSEGRSLADSWSGSPHAYLGLMTAEFPNLFFLLGPNSGLGHNSVVEMIEAQIDALLEIFGHLESRNTRTIEVKKQVEADYVTEIDRAMKQTVWVQGGCSSWYLDDTGRNSTLWPRSVTAYRARLRRATLDAYEILP